MINEKTKELMAAVASGADIYNYGDAKILRQLEKENPEMVDIVEARMYTGDGTDQVPYFGAILTDEGRAAIAL